MAEIIKLPKRKLRYRSNPFDILDKIDINEFLDEIPSTYSSKRTNPFKILENEEFNEYFNKIVEGRN
jgi:hypothetical protein